MPFNIDLLRFRLICRFSNENDVYNIGIYNMHTGFMGVGTGGLEPQPLKNTKTKGFLAIIGPDPLKNLKATKLAFNLGPICLDRPYFIKQKQNNPSKLEPSAKTFCMWFIRMLFVYYYIRMTVMYRAIMAISVIFIGIKGQ